MKTLNALREPLALVVVIGLALRLVTSLVSGGVYAQEDVYGSFAAAAGVLSYRASDPALVVVLTVLVAACVLTERSRHARGLTLAALITVGASVLLGLVFSLTGLTDGGDTDVVDTLDTLLLLVGPVVCGIVLVRLLQLQPATRPTPTPYAILPGPAQPPYAPADPYGGQPRPDTQYQPVWQPDVAAGAAWYSAGDAAAGAPAAGWGTPGQSGGWQPTEPPRPGAPEPGSASGPPPWNPNPS